MISRFDIREILVCDDIRFEDNGKAIIIGVYSGDILLARFPDEVRLSFWCQGTATGSEVGKIKLQFALHDEKGNRLAEPTVVEGDLKENGEAPKRGAIFAIAGMPLKIPSAGLLTISVQSADELIELVTKKIALRNPNSLPSVT